MDPVNYVHADGRARQVTSVEGGVNANAQGFYHPDSPSGKRIAASAEQPSEKWSHADLDAYAEKQGVEVTGTKAEKVAQLTGTADAGTADTPDLTTADRRVNSTEGTTTDDVVL